MYFFYMCVQRRGDGNQQHGKKLRDSDDDDAGVHQAGGRRDGHSAGRRRGPRRGGRRCRRSRRGRCRRAASLPARTRLVAVDVHRRTPLGARILVHGGGRAAIRQDALHGAAGDLRLRGP